MKKQATITTVEVMEGWSKAHIVSYFLDDDTPSYLVITEQEDQAIPAFRQVTGYKGVINSDDSNGRTLWEIEDMGADAILAIVAHETSGYEAACAIAEAIVNMDQKAANELLKLLSEFYW